jgi:hypothetical protein
MVMRGVDFEDGIGGGFVDGFVGGFVDGFVDNGGGVVKASKVV